MKDTVWYSYNFFQLGFWLMGGGGSKIFFNVDFSKRKYFEIYQDVFKINIERMKMKVLISLTLYAKTKKRNGIVLVYK